jgi:hypothetical protein
MVLFFLAGTRKLSRKALKKGSEKVIPAFLTSW